MTLRCVPKDTVGAYAAQEGCEVVSAVNCLALTSLTIPKGCRRVEVYNCPALTSLTVPKGCKQVDVYKCPALTSLTTPKGCEWVEVYNCATLTTLTIPEGCKRVNVQNCALLPALYRDKRGYVLLEAHGRYYAGCRTFTAAEAIAHWGANWYLNRERGAAFVAAVEQNEREKHDK